MALKLSHQTFCQLLAQSALIDEERLSGLQDQFAKKHPEAKPESCQEFAEFLIRENELTLWQAKKYKASRKVGIETVRELADVRNEHSASKAFIVTSSFLTEGALARVQRDKYVLGKVDRDDLEAWIDRKLYE